MGFRIGRAIRSRFAACWRAALVLHISRLIAAGLKLWRPSKILCLLVCLAAAATLAAGFAGGRQVWSAISGWAVPRPLPFAVALVAGLVLVEIVAAAALALIGGALQLGYDIERGRSAAILGLAALAASAASVLDLSRAPAPSLAVYGLPLPLVIALPSVVLAFWFVRTYLRPHAPAFREFRPDVVAARSFVRNWPHEH